jgi:O-antigen/teichoic acid export membrane protein
MLIRSALTFVRAIRLAPFDAMTPEGRSAERYRRVALSAISSGVARIASISTALVIIPLTVRYLGPERYGLYATITSIAGLVGWSDFGIGNGLVSELAAAHGRDDRRAAERATSTAFFSLLALALTLGAAFAAAYQFVPWPSVFNITGQGATEAGAATAAFVLGTLLALPLSVVQRAEIGLQETFVASAWQALGSLLGLIGVVTAVALDASLPFLVLAVSVAPALALAGNGVYFFTGRRPWLLPSLRKVRRTAAIGLLRVGALFFVLQVAIAVAYESDAIVLAQIRGPEAVATYSVTMRIFLIVPALAGFVLAPLWPAYGEAISRGEVGWVERALRRSIRFGLTLTIPVVVVLLVVARPLIQAWAGIRPPVALLVAAAAWIVLMPLSSAFAMFLNGARVIRVQIVLAILMMLSNLSLSIVLTRWLGISGVVWGSVLAQTVCVLIPAAVIVPRTLARLHAEQA